MAELVLLPDGTVETLARFAANPYRFIASVISLYILGAVFNLFGQLLGFLVFLFDTVVWAITGVGDTIILAGRIAGVNLLGIPRAINAALAELVAMAGPAAPIVTGVFLAVMLYLSYRVGIVLVRSVPVLRAIPAFLGLEP